MGQTSYICSLRIPCICMNIPEKHCKKQPQAMDVAAEDERSSVLRRIEEYFTQT